MAGQIFTNRDILEGIISKGYTPASEDYLVELRRHIKAIFNLTSSHPEVETFVRHFSIQTMSHWKAAKGRRPKVYRSHKKFYSNVVDFHHLAQQVFENLDVARR